MVIVLRTLITPHLFDSKNIVANFNSKGVMEITAIDEAALSIIDWDKVINMPAYKLYIEVIYFDGTNFFQRIITCLEHNRIFALTRATISSTGSTRECSICKFLTAMAEAVTSLQESC